MGGILERVFDDWENDATHPTLFLVDRAVAVSAAEALPSGTRKLGGQHPAWARAFGLQIEPWMPGRQVAWVRRSDGGWLALVMGAAGQAGACQCPHYPVPCHLVRAGPTPSLPRNPDLRTHSSTPADYQGNPCI